MQAIYLEQELQYNKTLEVPKPSAGEALIRSSLVGICNTDLELVKGYMGFEGVLGHEFVGVVEACDDTEWLGKRVVGEINCSPRNRIVDDPRHQEGRTVLGILGRNGSMAEYFLLPTENLLEVPTNLSDEKAVFVEPLAAAYQIAAQLHQLPKSALVLGDGKLGALCALALRDGGVNVCWTGKHRNKLDQLKDVLETALLSDGAEQKYPLVVEATGSADGLEMALQRVEPQGTVILKTTVASPHKVDLSTIVINEIKVVGSRCGRFAQALASLSSGRIDPSFLIEKIYPFSQAQAAFAHAATRGAAKVLLSFNASPIGEPTRLSEA